MSRSNQPSILDFRPATRSKPAGVVERRVVADRLKPHVVRFDAWLKEVAFLKATALAKATTNADNHRLQSRSTELGVEIVAHFEQFQSETADIAADGRVVLAGGKRSPLGGTFFEPTVVANVKADMLLAREETFGPLAGVIRFKDEEEAIRLANDTEFGLASYFYARDLSRVWRVAEGLEAGMVGINTGLISTEVAPFGGIKQSGLGREGSRHGLDDYMEIKYLCMGI